jgi:hypothetical protein
MPALYYDYQNQLVVSTNIPENICDQNLGRIVIEK